MSLIPRNSLFDFDHFFDHFRAPEVFNDNVSGTFSPRIEVKEKKGHYVISAELPGVDKDDVHVTLEHGILTLEAESHQEDKEEKDGRIIRQERRYGKFVRSFNLGHDVQEKDISAKFNNGVLTLSVPKHESPVESSRRISIQ
ncbi:Hsp20/alpha crystallin family protein [Pseudomaricurvus alkylphenolicus]|jgi:HSP20 family protein|uniref:Hsp20/alpha crystallin family protein n=1 Tax=Pseudomaricurvus alkylphenolicus TaxID=1306991 RepID=UPI0014215733|nr:Hsp20/alpha crystallin family protein [Pseudomaricurvus alkylphenolicus]NIB44335.1 Hsp20/alpha crystallin family protein [Pseudomaricurvus alkylphenolicus]